MRPLMNVKHRNDQYFHLHPLQGAFSLIASLTLAGLIIVVMLVSLAR
jgi:hypothetical protein